MRELYFIGEGGGEGLCDDAAGEGNRRGMAVTSCWKDILLNVAGALKGVDGVDSIKLPCVRGAWGPQAPVHSALNTGLVLFLMPRLSL